MINFSHTSLTIINDINALADQFAGKRDSLIQPHHAKVKSLELKLEKQVSVRENWGSAAMVSAIAWIALKIFSSALSIYAGGLFCATFAGLVVCKAYELSIEEEIKTEREALKLDIPYRHLRNQEKSNKDLLEYRRVHFSEKALRDVAAYLKGIKDREGSTLLEELRESHNVQERLWQTAEKVCSDETNRNISLSKISINMLIKVFEKKDNNDLLESYQNRDPFNGPLTVEQNFTIVPLNIGSTCDEVVRTSAKLAIDAFRARLSIGFQDPDDEADRN